MHEWISRDYIPEVIEDARDAGTYTEGASWIDLHHQLRSDTALLVFKPRNWLAAAHLAGLAQ
jgi:hypothetical protein